MTRRGSENSHEDEEGGGRALGLAAGSGLLPLAGAAASLEPATTTKQKREQEHRHRPAIRKETGNPRSGTETGPSAEILPAVALLRGVGLALHGGWS